MFSKTAMSGRIALAAATLAVVIAGGAVAEVQPVQPAAPESTAPEAEALAVEVYVAGVYQGRIRSGDNIHGPKAWVTLDRPGVATALVLTSFAPVLWEVTLSPGTPAPKIYLSQLDKDGARSAVTVNGEPAGVEWRDLPYAYDRDGEKFRRLVTAALGFGSEAGLADFRGSYEATAEPFAFSGPVDDPELAADYLATLVDVAALPAALLPLVQAGKPPPPEVGFTDAGFRLAQPEGTSTDIPVTLDVPPISWPVGATRDPATGRLYGVSLGGEGFIYTWDPATSGWSILRSMENVDASGIGFDDGTQSLVIVVLDRGGRFVNILRMATDGTVLMAYEFRPDDFPGLTDIYDPGNGPAPQIRVLGAAEGKVLLQTEPPHRGIRGNTGWRAWVLDIAGGTITLVGYGETMR